jgi:hypothetical protein
MNKGVEEFRRLLAMFASEVAASLLPEKKRAVDRLAHDFNFWLLLIPVTVMAVPPTTTTMTTASITAVIGLCGRACRGRHCGGQASYANGGANRPYSAYAPEGRNCDSCQGFSHKPSGSYKVVSHSLLPFR